MSWLKRVFPFNAEQTVNILSEFGPLVTMFVVNAAYGINAGTWALITTTLIAIFAMFWVFGRPPVFPLIASSVTVAFGALTLVTGDPMWVQIKVTIFNAMFAGVLFGGLWGHEERGHHRSMWAVIGLIAAGMGAQAGYLYMTGGVADFLATLTEDGAAEAFRRLPQLILVAAILIGFQVGSMLLKRNFFKYVFEKTFHYTDEGWDKFTWSFAWFFVFTAVANEAVRLSFKDTEVYMVLGHEMDGVNIWIMFKILIIMPLSGLYAWYLTTQMHKYRIPHATAAEHAGGGPGTPRDKQAIEYTTVAMERPPTTTKLGGGRTSAAEL